MSASTPDSFSYHGPPIYPQAVVLSTLAFLSLLLTIPPLILHLKTTNNLSTTILLLSMVLINLQNIINPIIWPNDNIPIWYSGNILCDIEAKLQVGLSVLIPSSTACICRNLALILSPRRSSIVPSPSTRRRRLNFELVLCVGLPLLVMALHILVQPYRYYIYGISGCQYSLQKSWVSVVLVLIWPVLTSLLGIVYSILIIVRLLRHKRQVSTVLAHAQVSKERFTRVFFLSGTFVVVCAPIAVYTCARTLEGSLDGWWWRRVHPRWWNELIFKVESGGMVWFDRWVQVGSGFVVFAVFGLGADALEMYRRWASKIGLERMWSWIRALRVERHEGGPAPSQVVERQVVARSRLNSIGPSRVMLGDIHGTGEGEESNRGKRVEAEISLEPIELESQ